MPGTISLLLPVSPARAQFATARNERRIAPKKLVVWLARMRSTENATVKNVVDNGLLGENNVRDQMTTLRDFTSGHSANYRAIHRDAVDAKTGTIRVQATFANSDKNLWPGQFVRLRVELADGQGAAGQLGAGRRRFKAAPSRRAVTATTETTRS